MRDQLATLLPSLESLVQRRSGWDEAQRRSLEQTLQVMLADYGEVGDTDATAQVDPLATLAETFGLDELDVNLLLVAAAPEVDASFAIAFGLLRGLRRPARVSVGLALELCGIGSLDPRGMERLGVSSALQRNGLLELEEGPWLTREISLPERVLGHVVGADVVDPAVGAASVQPLAVPVEGVELVARALGSGTSLVWIRSTTGAGGIPLAAGAFAAAGQGCICVDLERAAPQPSLEDLVRRALLEGALHGKGVIVAGADRLVAGRHDHDAAAGVPGAVLAAAYRAPVPVVMVARAAWDARWPVPFPLCVDAPAPSPADRTSAWVAAGGDIDVVEGLTGLRLGPEAVAQTASYATQLAAIEDVPVDAGMVRLAARRVSGSSAARLSSTSGPRTSFADLVLPPHTESTVRRLVGWARHRDEVLTRGSLLELGDKGAGLTALFTGSPGTGKTLAAHVVADELGVELLQIDLSAVVDKYIGETQKNLERVFAQAESLNVVLFFDEADALFGRRTEVRDSHDRHANQEVAYLLQRMEHFDGLTILATNLRGNLDEAFSRRLNFVVHFPDPDLATRRRLWTSHLERLGSLDPDDPPDVDLLAESVELAGGDIRNIVVAAGYDAVAAGHLPGMQDLRAATLGEFHKLGRRPPPGFGGENERIRAV